MTQSSCVDALVLTVIAHWSGESTIQKSWGRWSERSSAENNSSCPHDFVDDLSLVDNPVMTARTNLKDRKWMLQRAFELSSSIMSIEKNIGNRRSLGKTVQLSLVSQKCNGNVSFSSVFSIGLEKYVPTSNHIYRSQNEGHCPTIRLSDISSKRPNYHCHQWDFIPGFRHDHSNFVCCHGTI